MATYYIDSILGNDSNNGLSQDFPKKTQENINLKPGDSVLFKCGSIYDFLHLKNGLDENPIIYSSYGNGQAPIFSASTDASNINDWKEISPNIWQCQKSIPGEVGNFVFNGNECTAALRWEKSELSNQGDFWDSRFGTCEKKAYTADEEIVLLYSEKNPAEFYNSVECISYNKRILARTTDNIIIENLHFKNSGVHALAGRGKNVTIRNCVIENIGGCVWDKDLKVRFGNGIEFWVYGENVLIENCVFKNIYDSCVTHQGPGKDTIPTRNFICRNNVFDTYSMAAFEYRDKMPIDSTFENNVCRNAGCGFGMLGEDIPRKSEIWPQPMGHHIFLWRIDEPTDEGRLEIKNNIFQDAPVGSAIYSIISPAAEVQMELKNNILVGNISEAYHLNN